MSSTGTSVEVQPEHGQDLVVEPELFSYSSDVACVTDVVVGNSFTLSSK